MSDDSTITVTPQCGFCGGTLETEDNPSPASIVTCKACKQSIGTYGDVQAQVGKAARDKFEELMQPHIEDMRRALKGFGRVHFKL